MGKQDEPIKRSHVGHRRR